MSWQMGVQGKELVNLTWDPGGFRAGAAASAGAGHAADQCRAAAAGKSAEGPLPWGGSPCAALPPVPAAYGFGRLSKVVQTALIRGGLENITLRDIRAAGGQREDDQTLLEWTRAHGSITRRDVMALLNLSDTAAYLRLRRLVGRRSWSRWARNTISPEQWCRRKSSGR